MTEQDLHVFICNEFLDGDLEFPIDPDTRLVEEGICDSLGLVRIVAQIEARHPGIRIQDQEVTRDNLGSISQIVGFVQSKLHTGVVAEA